MKTRAKTQKKCDTSRLLANNRKAGKKKMATGRFAPSPTGDLHLGSARTALGAWLAARSGGGGFVLRIEDLDRAREVAGAADRMLEDLRFLGLDWDQGPDVDGPHRPYVQSERTAHYQRAVEQLVAEEKAFYCFCSRSEVALAAAPHGPSDDGPRYPGSCRNLSAMQVSERSRTRTPSVRLRVDSEGVHFADLLHGAKFENVAATVGDFVIRRADQVFAYQLAVVVDDAAMAIDQVVRGDDLLSSTARQLLLYRALGLASPQFGHLPLVLGPDGARLSKRHGAISIAALREQGWTAERFLSFLGSSFGLCSVDECLSPHQLAERFDWTKIPKQPIRIDPSLL